MSEDDGTRLGDVLKRAGLRLQHGIWSDTPRTDDADVIAVHRSQLSRLPELEAQLGRVVPYVLLDDDENVGDDEALAPGLRSLGTVRVDPNQITDFLATLSSWHRDVSSARLEVVSHPLAHLRAWCVEGPARCSFEAWGELLVPQAALGSWHIECRLGSRSTVVIHPLKGDVHLDLRRDLDGWDSTHLPEYTVRIEGLTSGDLLSWAVAWGRGQDTEVHALAPQPSDAGGVCADVGVPREATSLRLVSRLGSDRKPDSGTLALPLVSGPDGRVRVRIRGAGNDPVQALEQVVVSIGTCPAPLIDLATLVDVLAGGKPPPVGRLRQYLAEDPMTGLLIAAICQRAGESHHALRDEALTRAREILGDGDPDVRALSGNPRTDLAPRLLVSWMAVVDAWASHTTASELAWLVSSEDAPGDFPPAAGRRTTLRPWLVWQGTEDERPPVVERMAELVWPGWAEPRFGGPDVTPPPAELPGLARIIASFEVSPECLRHLTVKQPPIQKLVAHESISFVGATIDQLAAALVVSHALRRRRPWERIELFFLDDGPLSKLISGDRSPEALILARSRSEHHLRHLLPHVARSWALYRYEQPYAFASVWDLDRPTGWVHVSPYLWGQDLRTAPYWDDNRPHVIAAWREALASLRSCASLIATSYPPPSR